VNKNILSEGEKCKVKLLNTSYGFQESIKIEENLQISNIKSSLLRTQESKLFRFPNPEAVILTSGFGKKIFSVLYKENHLLIFSITTLVG